MESYIVLTGPVVHIQSLHSPKARNWPIASQFVQVETTADRSCVYPGKDRDCRAASRFLSSFSSKCLGFPVHTLVAYKTCVCLYLSLTIKDL